MPRSNNAGSPTSSHRRGEPAIVERTYEPLNDMDRRHAALEEAHSPAAGTSADGEDSAKPSRPAAAGPTMADVFGPKGLLEKCHPGYEYRRSQLEMAELVDAAFREKRQAVVEAGTGTGKTLAYLIPAIRSGRRVVVSTATKSLQEQLFTKDIPFLQKHFARELKVAVMKGRGNFLCRQKVTLMKDQPMLRGLDEVDWFAQIRDWAELTETGDRAELNFLPDDADLWPRLDARRDTCTGQKCADFNRCFITWMHQRAREADIIIVNHHLFFADLALRQDDFGSILPDYTAVIFDEAHEIEDVAGDYFGRQISNYRFEELGRDTEHALRLKGLGTPPLLKRVNKLRERSRAFFDALPGKEGRFPFTAAERQSFIERNA
ncbi:MAG: ATP-dependent DNA helicase, partial [Candidatus Acidiferrales bacterium]